MPGQNIQQTQGVRIVGPVIVSEGQLLRRLPQPGKSPPEPLPGWRHGLVTCCRNGSGASSANNESVHTAAIVKAFQMEDRRFLVCQSSSEVEI